MKAGILFIIALLFSSCTTLPTFAGREQKEDKELEKIYQELAQEKENVDKIDMTDIPDIPKKANIGEKEKKEEKENVAVAQVEPKVELPEQRILFVGDSVMKGSEAQLKKMFPKAIIDSSVSRQFTFLPSILKKIQSQKEGIPNLVVIHLGSNGMFNEKQMEETMKILGNKRKVFLINCKVEKPWQGPVNDFLREQGEKYSNIRLIDWYQLSASRSNYFAKDGVHPSRMGAQMYRQIIQQKLEKEF